MSKAIFTQSQIVDSSNIKYIKGIDSSGNDCISVPPSGGSGKVEPIIRGIKIFPDPSSITTTPYTKIDSFEISPDGYTRIAGRIIVNWKSANEEAITINPSIKFKDSNVIFVGTVINLSTGIEITYGDGSINFISYDSSTNTLTLVPQILSSASTVSGLVGFNFILEGYKADDAVIPTEDDGYIITSVNLGINEVSGSGGSGGVIDGTLYTLSNGDTKKLVYRDDFTSSPYIYEYIVENDCLFYTQFSIDAGSSNETTIIKLNDEVLDYFTEEYHNDDQDSFVLTLPIKSGTKVTYEFGDKPYNGNSGYKSAIVIKEYKITSINPQAAFPDWDTSKEDILTESKVIDSNGYLLIKPTEVRTGDKYVLINGIQVYRQLRSPSHAYDDLGTEKVVPVSKGDSVEFDPVSTQITFYPAKSVAQSSIDPYLAPDSNRHLTEWNSLSEAGISSNNVLTTYVADRKYYSNTYTVSHDCFLIFYVDWDSTDEGDQYYCGLALQYLDSNNTWIDLSTGVGNNVGAALTYSGYCKAGLNLRLTSRRYTKGSSPGQFKVSFSELY